MLTEELLKFSQTLQLSAIGIAPAIRYENAPEGHRPKDFLPNARSVITFAYHLNNGPINNLPQTRNQYMIEFEVFVVNSGKRCGLCVSACPYPVQNCNGKRNI